MRHFAAELRSRGWKVLYRELNDPLNSGDLAVEIESAIQSIAADRVIFTEPGKWQLRETLLKQGNDSNIPYDMLEDDRFLCAHAEFDAWAQGRKQLRMEYFYREMRRKSAFLWTAMRQWAVNGTSMPKIGNRLEMRAACRRRFNYT